MHAAANAPIWQPSAARIARANLLPFIERVRRDWGVHAADYAALYDFSVTQPERFWLSVWDHCGIVAERRGDVVVRDLHRMPGAVWFPDARLNVAQNLLRRRDDADAIVFRGEDRVRRRLSFAELYDEVSRAAQALRAAGVRPGDRVAAVMPNIPEATIAVLATAAIGAVWSSCSPDLGVTAAVERLGQVAPVVLFTSDGYFHNGQTWDTRDKAARIARAMPSVRIVVQASYTGAPPDAADRERVVSWDDFVAPCSPGEIAFPQLPFDHPLFILFSSGTTGVPKCIVHGAGGALLASLKGHDLQYDIKPGDRLFWWTTIGWVVWNIMLFGLGCGATLLLYDGAPSWPGPAALFDFMAEEKASFARLTPGYLDSLRKAGVEPARSHDLSALRYITAGSAPLSGALCGFVHEKIKADVQLASPAGGTDTFASLVTGNPIGPVWAGEIQARALGMKVEIFDDDGKSVRGAPGELVCTLPFPSMPLGFWNDPDGERYRATYFEHYPNVWRHGDWAELTPRDGVIIYGRSDATLNARGVRIGTAEIYRQVAEVPEVLECVAVAQETTDGSRVVLFVRLRDGATLDGALRDRINARLREHASPRHVPDRIVQVADIPRTATGKPSEIAVRETINGREVRNRDSLINPSALALFRDLPALRVQAPDGL